MGQNIAIAGAGMGGLAAAALLHDAGHQVTVFDQFDTPGPVGSGLMIQPIGQAILSKIGALDDALAVGCKIKGMKGREVDHGGQVLDETYDLDGIGTFGLAIHRAGLFDALFMAVQRRGIPIETGFCVAETDSGQLIDKAGVRTNRFDLVVDALGAKSALSPLRSRPLPFGAVWSTVDWPDTQLPHDHLTQRYQSARHMIGALPCGQFNGRDSAAIFWSLPVASFDEFRVAGIDAWRDHAARLWPEFSAFADQITHMDQLAFATYGHGTLRKRWSPGLVHIGDSAHCASPQLGQGANMAMIDAAALAWALSQRSGDDALRLYQSSRRWHIAFYQMMSWTFTPMYQSNSRALPFLRDKILFPTSRIKPVRRMLSRLVRGDFLPPISGYPIRTDG
ncbi:MAG: FAD-dependent oxidoreductase [Planktomarina sp.]